MEVKQEKKNFTATIMFSTFLLLRDRRNEETSFKNNLATITPRHGRNPLRSLGTQTFEDV